MNRLVRLAALALPLAGLAGLWFLSDRTFQQGTEWEVPIDGFDPRDFLRGHYVEFTYDWPGIEEFRDVPPHMLCLEGTAPQLTRVTAFADAAAAAPCAHPVRADASGVYGWEGLARGRLYLDQDRAMAMQQELRDADQRGIVTIRQREDGSFAAIAIRFRPLTADERAIRDAPNVEALMPPPPPIMAPVN
ncbi:MAG: GDYXXLXY domain-containing protein [Erythrobacter sp.]|nr:GDYXXLXY domain-containing protein [Erythrobacter sp.]